MFVNEKCRFTRFANNLTGILNLDMSLTDRANFLRDIGFFPFLGFIFNTIFYLKPPLSTHNNVGLTTRTDCGFRILNLEFFLTMRTNKRIAFL